MNRALASSAPAARSSPGILMNFDNRIGECPGSVRSPSCRDKGRMEGREGALCLQEATPLLPCLVVNIHNRRCANQLCAYEFIDIAPSRYFSMGAPIRLPHSVQDPS